MTHDRGVRRLLHRAHLLASAWRLHTTAQRLAGGAGWTETRDRLLAARGLPERVDPADAVWAAARTGRLGRLLAGRRDTCLLRSLVAGALVADTPGVAVRIGFRRPWATGDLLDGHAWLSVADRALTPAEPDDVAFEEVVALPLERAR